MNLRKKVVVEDCFCLQIGDSTNQVYSAEVGAEIIALTGNNVVK